MTTLNSVSAEKASAAPLADAFQIYQQNRLIITHKIKLLAKKTDKKI